MGGYAVTAGTVRVKDCPEVLISVWEAYGIGWGIVAGYFAGSIAFGVAAQQLTARGYWRS